MSTEPNPRAVLGGNNPPEPIDPAKPVLDLQPRVDKLKETADIWIKAVPKLTTEDQAKKCADFREQVKAEIDALDDAHKIAKAPFLDACQKLDKAKRDLKATLLVIDQAMRDLEKPWLQELKAKLEAEAKRLADEAAAKAKLAEEAARKAQAPTADIGTRVAAQQAIEGAADAQAAATTAAGAKAHIRGDLSSRATGLREFWYAEIIDFNAVFEHFKNDPQMREVVQAVADREARAQKSNCNIPGMFATYEERPV